MLTNQPKDHTQFAHQVVIDVSQVESRPTQEAIAAALVENAVIHQEWRTALRNALSTQGYWLDGRNMRFHVIRIDGHRLSPDCGFKGLELALEAIFKDMQERAQHGC